MLSDGGLELKNCNKKVYQLDVLKLHTQTVKREEMRLRDITQTTLTYTE